MEVLIELVIEGVVWVVVEVIGELLIGAVSSPFDRNRTAATGTPAPVQPPGPAGQVPGAVAAETSPGAGCAVWALPVILLPAMFGIGLWFGMRRWDIDPDDTPTTLFTALALTGLFLLGAVVRAIRSSARREVIGAPAPPTGLQADGWQALLLPWHWSPARFLLFAAANAALAAGVFAGFR